ncbi:MAG: GNAT family N-acetyltransferase [Anaerolineae bacterium]|nr:GNAT family N-acetyltransferase [Anaerolineae bacterium]
MKFLIDTNIFIPLEPTDFADLEAGTPAAIEFARIVSETGHQLYVHPATRLDIRRDVDEGRRKVREILFNKYPCLPNPPPISSRLESILGRAEPQTNEWVDNHLIAALDADAVDFLVTEDVLLRKKAGQLGLENRAATVAEAISIVQDLFDIAPMPPPAVRAVKAHALNEADPIFKSFREDYPTFDKWLTKCKREHRQAWVIDVGNSRLAAVCIIKQEKSVDFGLAGKILKICSFKVSEEHNGFRFGELLLKTVFVYASSNRYDWIYVTVFEKYGDLIGLLEDFGFHDMGHRTKLGEVVLAKPMSFTEADRDSQHPLAFNIRYGPFAAKIKGALAFVVPIKPQYHRLLFPEAEQQLELMPGRHPFGNSIRKAYLSNAAIRTITPGANLLFYRSEDIRSVTCLGIVESTLVSSSPIEIARYVGKRTVYRFAEIEALCQREVLAILFRQSRILKDTISLEELIANSVLSAAPRSILTVPEGSTAWLQTRLNG